MIDALAILSGAGLIILLGFLGNYIFQKTMIPDILWLLLLGLLLGPILGLFQSSFLIDVAPFFASVAILIILFEGGLHTNLDILIKESPISIVLAVSGIIVSMISVSLLMYFLFHWPLLNGLLLGAMIGGSSSPIVVSLTQKLAVRQKVRTWLNLESTITDALCVVVAIVIAEFISKGGYSLAQVANNILGSFSIGAMLGLIAGIFSLRIISRLKKRPFEYMLTLAILLILYSLTEWAGGSGAIAALIFGVVLANGRKVSRIFKFDRALVIDKQVEKFHSEVSFLIRTFFFVYLGVIATVTNFYFILLGVSITLLLYLARNLSVFLSTLKLEITKTERDVMKFMMPRGLAAAVLSQLPLAYGIENSQLYTDLTLIVIVCSILLCSFGIISIKGRLEKLAKQKK